MLTQRAAESDDGPFQHESLVGGGTTCWLHYLCKQDAESEDGNIGIMVPLTLSMSQG